MMVPEADDGDENLVTVPIDRRDKRSAQGGFAKCYVPGLWSEPLFRRLENTLFQRGQHVLVEQKKRNSEIMIFPEPLRLRRQVPVDDIAF